MKNTSQQTENIDFEDLLSNLHKEFDTPFEHTQIPHPTKLELAASFLFIALLIPLFLLVTPLFNNVYSEVNQAIIQDIESQITQMDIQDSNGNTIKNIPQDNSKKNQSE